MFEIQKGVPAPTPDSGSKNIAFIKTLEVGDSFVDDRANIASTRNIWFPAAKGAGIKIKTRMEATGGIRIWRIA